MRQARLQLRSLAYHWRTNLAVVLGASVATAALTGALIVGDSMRGSLAETALARLGRVDYALVAPRFFPADLAQRVSSDADYTKQFAQAVPIILMQGAARHADTRALAGGTNILGVDQRFWQLAQSEPRPLGLGPAGAGSGTGEFASQHGPSTEDDGVMINDALAVELGAKVGDDIVLRLRRPSAISTESLLGRRDESAASVRLPISRILPAKGLGGFGIEARQAAPKNVFVPLETLQRALKVEGAANALLVASIKRGISRAPAEAEAAWLQLRIEHHLALADLGLRLHVRADQSYVALESEALLLPPSVETAAVSAAELIEADPSPLLTHLANSISISKPADSDVGEKAQSPSIPYSTIAAIEPRSLTAAQLARVTRDGAKLSGAGDLLLNRWAADDLQAKIGDRVEVTFYVSGPLGRIDTRDSTFTLRGIVEMEGPAIDRGFIPEYPGVTDTENLADWDPPFPVDLKKVREKDEQYWDDYRTAPKAFITLQEGQELWAAEGGRLGRLTSIRLRPRQAPQAPSTRDDHQTGATAEDSPPADEVEAQNLQALAARFGAALLEKIKPAELGFALQPVRANAVSASRGDTDFGGLFIGFSFFLIAAAAMLVGLLFRLGVERRATEIGTLLAMGFAPRTLTMHLVTEGLMLSTIGAAVGLVAASGYAWLMLAGLRTWWSAAVNAPFLQLHALPASYAIGFFASVFIAAGSAGWAVRGLTRRSPRSLLSGSIAAEKSRAARSFALDTLVAVSSFTLAAALALIAGTSDRLSPVLAFFFAGALVLIGAMAAFGRWLRRPSTRVLHMPGVLAVARLAMRNAPRYRGRGMLTVGLIASATFVIVALEAFRLDTSADVHARDSGTGGFALFAESAVPLPYDLNTPAGREALGLETPLPSRESGSSLVTRRGEGEGGESETGKPFEIYSFRLRPGDEASCLNLYVSVQPRIAGAPDAFIERGGFAFAGARDKSGEWTANPWHLLHEELGDDVVPAIGDEASVLWQLHAGLGKDFTITDEQGREVQLRFVALLKGSALQDEIIVSEENFERLFPSIEGRSFFLLDVPPRQADKVEQTLEQELDRFGFDVGSTASRLAAYQAVQNTYLSTFQTLGGLGLVLGTFGLAAILLRNVWERRRELALMRATGFSRFFIATTVLLENALLVVVGLASGVAAAAVAVAPRVMDQPESIPLRSLSLLLALVLLSGFSAGVVGLLSTLRLNLVSSLRAE